MDNENNIIADLAFALKHDQIVLEELHQYLERYNELMDEIEEDEDYLNSLTEDDNPEKREKAKQYLIQKVEQHFKSVK